MKNIIKILFALLICCSLSNDSIAQGNIGQYPGAGIGFDSGCGYGNAFIPAPPGSVNPATTDIGLAGNVCGGVYDVNTSGLIETANGFDIAGFGMVNFDVNQEANYGFRVFYGPQDNCCTICFDSMLDLNFGATCGDFPPLPDLSGVTAPAPVSMPIPVPANFGLDIFGQEIIAYENMCPNTEYFVSYQFVSVSAIDVTDPDGNDCALDDALITTVGTESIGTIVAPGTRDSFVVNASTLTLQTAADCNSPDVVLDLTVDVSSGCSITLADGPGICSKGLEIELRTALSCGDGTTIDLMAGPFINDPTSCIIGVMGTDELMMAISLGTGVAVCDILACDPAATIEVYARHTFCEADDINGDGTGVDEDVFVIDLAAALAGVDCSNCAPPPCEPYNAFVSGPACDGYQVCVGYTDDLGIDPTGGSVTASDDSGLTGTVIDDGMTVVAFDADGDGTNDSSGFCYTYALTNETCDPVPYTPLVTVTCSDGTPATYVNGATLTNYDYLAGIFGVMGGTAAYPNLVGLVTNPTCPVMPDGSDAAAGFVEVFPADAMGNPIAGAAACITVTGDTPGCETAGGNAATVVQWNPISDPLLMAVMAPEYACGLDATVDLSFDCGVCDPAACTPFDAVVVAPFCDGYQICIGYQDATGADPTGSIVTVTDDSGLPVTVIDDGMTTLFTFDASDDGVDQDDASGYCYTAVLTNETCDPVAYTPLLTVTCADGSEATYSNGATLTNYDYLDGIFGFTGGTAAYPNIVGVVTPAACPTQQDGSDAVAAMVEVFPADAMGNPIAGAAACTTIAGDTPACETAGGDAATIVQLNPISDPLLTAAGAAQYLCGLDATADLSFDCPVCGVDPPAMCAGNPDYSALTEVCSAVDADGDGNADGNYTLSPGAGCMNPVSTAFPGDDRYDYFITIYIDPVTMAVGPAPAGYDAVTATNTFAPELANVLTGSLGQSIGLANGTQCSTDVPLVLTNPGCTPTTFTFFIVPIDYDSDLDGDTMFGDVLDDADPGYCPPVRFNVDVYPNLTATVIDDGSTCGTAQIDLLAEDGMTVCDSQTLACTSNGEVLNADFSGSFADPAGCSTLIATATCNGCQGDPIDISISDPCDCASPDNIDLDGDGILDLVVDVITITGPAGDTWCISNNPMPAAQDMTGTDIVMDGTVCAVEDPANPGTYTITIYHPADGTGYGPLTFTSGMGLPDQSVSNETVCDCSVCDLSISIVAVSCDDGTTPEDPSDDVITYAVTVTGGPGTSWSGTDTNGETYTNVAYGTAFTSTMPLMGPGSVTVTVIDDIDAACTDMATVPFDGCTMPAIPTLSQWGLMILALLMMTFGALKIGASSLRTARSKK